MRLRLFAKTLAYRILKSGFGRIFLRLTRAFVRVPHLKGKKEAKHDFCIAITVDTEAGYVGKREYRTWQIMDPKSIQGYTSGIRNILRLAEEKKIRMTFLLSSQCFAASKKEKEQILHELGKAKKRHEIGYHLHPSIDYFLQRKIGKTNRYNSAKFYTKTEIIQMLKAGKEILKEEIGVDAISFRWGNWGLDEKSIKLLDEAGFKIDSSAVPGMKGHLRDDRTYNWSKYKNRHRAKIGNIIELPIATFTYFGMNMRADPICLDLLKYAFRKYHRDADRSKEPFTFTVITHSPEATDQNGKATKIIETLADFIDEAKKHDDVRFVTLKEAANAR
jgi:hypothetical protein